MLVESFSGIRGVYPKEINEAVVRKYSYAFREFLKSKTRGTKEEPRIVVGRDTRKSSSCLKDAISDVFFDIIDVGVMPIACVELAVREYRADGGIMVTASHNPPEHNGLKFLGRDGSILRQDEIRKVINRFHKINKMDEEDFMKKLYNKKSRLKIKKIEKRNIDLLNRYIRFIKGRVGKIKNKSKVIVDPNGGAGIILEKIRKKLGIRNLKVINRVAGKFLREIEPKKESLAGMWGIIKKEKADFLAGFDCDADRLEILLKDGSLLNGNQILAIIVNEVLSKAKNKTVVINDATSNMVRKVVEKHNGKVIEVEVGETNIVNAMLEYGSVVGGEGSNGGVIIYPNRCRDGILSLLYIIKIISMKTSIEELIMKLPRYYTIQKNIKFMGDIDELKRKIKTYYSQFKIQMRGGKEGSLKVMIDKDSFVWFRASKTESNLLRVIADSNERKKSKRLIKEAVSLIYG